jgi:hypothetical protein
MAVSVREGGNMLDFIVLSCSKYLETFVFFLQYIALATFGILVIKAIIAVAHSFHSRGERQV